MLKQSEHIVLDIWVCITCHFTYEDLLFERKFRGDRHLTIHRYWPFLSAPAVLHQKVAVVVAVVILYRRRHAGHHRPLDRTKCEKYLPRVSCPCCYDHLPRHGEVTSGARLRGQVSRHWLVLWRKKRVFRIYWMIMYLTDEEIMLLTLVLWPDWGGLEEGAHLVTIH